MTCLKCGLFIGVTFILDELIYALAPFMFLFKMVFPMNRLQNIVLTGLTHSELAGKLLTGVKEFLLQLL